MKSVWIVIAFPFPRFQFSGQFIVQNYRSYLILTTLAFFFFFFYTLFIRVIKWLNSNRLNAGGNSAAECFQSTLCSFKKLFSNLFQADDINHLINPESFLRYYSRCVICAFPKNSHLFEIKNSQSNFCKVENLSLEKFASQIFLYNETGNLIHRNRDKNTLIQCYTFLNTDKKKWGVRILKSNSKKGSGNGQYL